MNTKHIINTGSQECKREAYRRAHHAAKIQVFLEAMLGLTPLECSRLPFGSIRATLTLLARGEYDAEQAVTYLRRTAKESQI